MALIGAARQGKAWQRGRARQRQPEALSHRRRGRATVPAPLPSGCSAPVSGLAGCLLGLPCRLPPSRAAWPPCPGGFCATVAAWRCLDCRPVQASIPLHHSRSPSRALCVHAAAAARRRRPWASLRGSMACPATEVSCSPSWAHVSAFIELAMIVHRNLYKLSLTQTVYVVG